MPSKQVTLQALGLNYSPNLLGLPQGSLVQADDVIIRSDNTVESRRGYKGYSQGLQGTTDRVKQLVEYKDRILAHISNKLEYDTGVLDVTGKAIFAAFSGTYLETQTGLRIKSIEANKNLYFTTAEGIKKISAKTSADFTTDSGFIVDAGAVKALDISASLDVTQGQLSGFLPADSAVAYRVVWGYKDTNDNLILGTPSNQAVVYNYLSDTIALDLNALALILDLLNQSGSLITDGNYATSYYSPANSDANSLQNNILALAAQIDEDIHLAHEAAATGVPLVISAVDITNNIATVTFSSGDPTTLCSINDSIELRNLPTPFDVLNGIHVLDISPTTSTLSFTFTHADIVSAPVATGDIYSANYRNIINTGDLQFPTPLSQQIVSIPATSNELRTIANTLFRISERLKVELSGVISSSLETTYVTSYTTTQSANTIIDITIPTGINDQYFYQIYRTLIFTATDLQTLGGSGGIPVVPDDEMRLVFEGFPTTAEKSAGLIVYQDTSPESLVQNNTNLYTNPQTGTGILSANDIPPFAKDINRFKNVTFYANTRTRHRIPAFQLLGLANITSGDQIVIGNTTSSITYTFVSGTKEKTSFTLVAADPTALKLAIQDKYFTLNNANNTIAYYVWFRYDGAGTDPAVSGKIGIPVDVLTGDSVNTVAEAANNTIQGHIFDFTSTVLTDTFTVENTNEGMTTDATVGSISPTNLTIVINTQGNGEDASIRQVLLSSLVSAAQAIEETAKSLVRVINKQTSSIINAFYVSSDTTPPGQINLEMKNLDPNPFYVLGSNSGIGSSFNPDITPDRTDITSIDVSNPTLVTVSGSETLVNGDQIMVVGSDSTPSIDGIHTVTVPPGSNTTFTIPIDVTVAGTQGSWSKLVDVAVSTNEVKPNRIYYSKVSQPEAVPLLNYFDISAEDKEILRIFPLRDTLFAFKQDGTYRISGASAPFVTSLLNSSYIVQAPDSVDVSNNIVYSWTTKGITPITESGSSTEISRPIDTEILRLASSVFTNFSTLTWGMGYDSDSSYIVYTNSSPDDDSATIAFRYCTLTNTWTNFQRSQTCGALALDLQYLGSGTENIIDVERKQFNRTDYADSEFTVNLADSSLFNNGSLLRFVDVNNIDVGDVITQEQTLSIYIYNKLLIQLDLDPTVHDADYYSSLHAISGDNMRDKIVALAVKLDLDTGITSNDFSSRIAAKSGTVLSNSIANPTVITTSTPHGLVDGRIVTILGTQTPASVLPIIGTNPVSNTGTFGVSTTFSLPIAVKTAGGTGLTFSTASNLNTFADIKACFNDIVSRLNSDASVTFNNYKPVADSTLMEAVVLAVDVSKNKVTLNLPLEWVVGPMTVYNAIPCQFTYAPITMDDPLYTKHISEATVMYNTRAITQFVISFSSDLLPQLIPTTMYGQGNGIFGMYSPPGFGYGFFGGAGNSAPFRTLIPRQSQRCRFLNMQINHTVAREQWKIFGVTLTGEVGISQRGYR